MKNNKRNKNSLALRLAAIAMAFVFGAGIWGQSSVVSYASNTLGSQGNALNNETAADPEVEAIVEENQEEPAATGTTAAKVKVIEASVRVRKEASTSSDIAGNLSSGDEVDVVGETNGADGYLWYQISGSISGYVRSDLVEVTETVQPVVEETPVEVPETPEETPVETPEVPAEYAVVFADDGTGVNDWYLNDNINGTRYKVTELLNAEQTNAGLLQTIDEETGSLRTIIIVLAVIIALLVVVVTILIFKLRSAYDDGYEYDDEEDEDEEDDEEDEEEDDEPRRRGGFLRRRPSRYDEDDEDEEEEEDEEDEEEDRYTRRAVRHARRDEAPRAASKKNYQSKNFLNVDEEEDMDFEFLDLK